MERTLKKFTLIELLIVIAIIGILFSVLLPSLGKARQKAMVAVCLSNQKQLAIAYNAYASQNDQFAVQHTWYNDFAGKQGNYGWSASQIPEEGRPLNAYASPEIATCPSDIGDSWYRWNYNESYNHGSSYIAPFATRNTIYRSTNTSSTTNIMLTKFDFPDKKILFHNVNIQYPRDFNHVSGKARWHDYNEPKYPVSFMDGTARIVNFNWRKQSGYYPRARNAYGNSIEHYGDLDYELKSRGVKEHGAIKEFLV